MSQVVSVRFGDQEYSNLVAIAKQANLPISDVIRQMVSGEDLKDVYTYMDDQPKEIVKELKKLNKAVNNISNRLDGLPREVVQEVRSDQS